MPESATVSAFNVMLVTVGYPIGEVFMGANVAAVGTNAVFISVRTIHAADVAFVISVIMTAIITADRAMSVVPLVQGFVKMQSASV